MSEDPRKHALEALLRFELPLDDSLREVNRVSGETDVDVVVLLASHVRSILDRFLRGELSARDVENWAEAIDAREGIATESGTLADLRRVIFELANPEINSATTPAVADRLIAILNESRD